MENSFGKLARLHVVIMLGIKDAVTTQRLDAVFEKYAPLAKEVEFEQWCKRGLWHKMRDNAFYMLNEVL